MSSRQSRLFPVSVIVRLTNLKDSLRVSKYAVFSSYFVITSTRNPCANKIGPPHSDRITVAGSKARSTLKAHPQRDMLG